MKPHTRYLGAFRWEGVAGQAYKPTGHSFHEVERQVLAEASGLPWQLRYFEVTAGGHTTLERHHHAHTVVVLRGEGRALVGTEILDLRPYDIVCVAPDTWHQFRARSPEPLGFLCLVAPTRDHPVEPTPDELRQLRATSAIAAFLDS